MATWSIAEVEVEVRVVVSLAYVSVATNASGMLSLLGGEA